jgi:hypothetical protein
MKPVIFAHPTFRNLRPKTDPEPQVAACTELREAIYADGNATSVTTQLPKRGGTAIMVGWWKDEGGRRIPVEGPFSISEDGEVSTIA